VRAIDPDEIPGEDCVSPAGLSGHVLALAIKTAFKRSVNDHFSGDVVSRLSLKNACELNICLTVRG
jgi:hypothetical protein